MAKAKQGYTPGPWTMSEQCDDIRPTWNTMPKAEQPIDATPPTGTRRQPMIVVSTEKEMAVAYVWDFHGKQAMKANACIIAAAPALLAACKLATDRLRTGSHPALVPQDVLAALDAAIALAEGK